MSSAALYMDRTLTASAPLTAPARRALLAAFLAANAVIAVFLVAIGAFPVPIFLGLDIVGLLIAFRVMDRRARTQGERILVTADRVTVEGAGRRERWSSATAFTRVALAGDGRRGGPAGVRLSLSGRSTLVGSRLGAQARADLAVELQEAIRRAGRERWSG